MATRKKKISIEEAMDVLQASGMDVRVKMKESSKGADPLPVEVQGDELDKIQRVERGQNPYGQTSGQYAPRTPKFTKIALYAKHSIGSGGVTVVDGETKQIEHAGVESYGPGIVSVPTEFVDVLLYRDQKAQAADEAVMSRVPVHRLIVQKIDSHGNRSDVGIAVPEDILDPGNMLTQLPSQYIYRVS